MKIFKNWISAWQRRLERFVMWRIRFWWMPPKGIRSFGCLKLYYEGITSYGLFLYIVHIELSDDDGFYDKAT